MMGFHVTDEGFSIVLDKRVPQLLERALPEAVDAFLESNGVARVTAVSAPGCCPPPRGRLGGEPVSSVLALRTIVLRRRDRLCRTTST